jgi:hypothetical protein
VTQIETLPAALQELLDKEEIKGVIARFCRSWDRRDRDGVVSCYHPEAVDEHGDYCGLGVEYFDTVRERDAEVPMLHHHLGQSVIELDGDVAVGETYCIATLIVGPGDGDQAWNLLVRYVDRFERRDGAWKIADRFVHFDGQYTVPGGPVTQFPEHTRGRRDEQDRAQQLFAGFGRA